MRATRGRPVTGAGSRTGALPVASTPLIGRDADLTALAAELTGAEARLITVTGPPGVGKTRLAVAAASAARSQFPSGVVFVDLTLVRDPDLVLPAVARALGLGDRPGRQLEDRIRTAVAGRGLLLVVDNFEHVIDAGADVAAPLMTCPRLQLLVTSRERLHLHDEREYPLAPLALPEPEDVGDPDRLVAAPSVAMLLHRVRGFQPDFAVTTANAEALAEICARLDGLPLALELAAARMKLFTPGELTFRLRHRMALLTSGARDGPDRHRTLRAALTWSHNLLTPDERAVFRRLSVFVGGWTVDAAQHVCGVADAVEVIASLVDKSMVGRRDGASCGFVMLESLRDFAGELLADHGEVAATRDRHARFYAAYAERMEASIGTSAEAAMVSEVRTAESNLHEAFGHASDTGRTDMSLQLAGVLGWYCYMRGHLGQGQEILERSLALAEAAPRPPPDRALAGALQVAGVLALARGDLDGAEDLLDRGLRIVHRLGDQRRTAIDSAFRGRLARARGDLDGAIAHHRRAAALHAELGNAPGLAWARHDLGLLARRRGDADGAVELLTEALSRFREGGYRWAVGCAGWALATVELRRGRVDAAADLLVEAMDGVEAADDGRGLAHCLEAAAGIACARGVHRTATQLLGAAAALRERLAAPLPDEERGEHHTVAQRARRELGPEDTNRARRWGRELLAAQALALAHRVVRAPDPAPTANQPHLLTPREQEVARLIAGGRTNRQIGRELGIAEKTAEVHVHHIIGKLDARSRSEVAAWVGARHGTSASR